MEKIKKFQLGKRGVSQNFIEQIKNSFKNTKRIKISVLKSCCRNKEDIRNIAEELIKNFGEKFSYKIIGFVIVLMKR